MSQIHGRIAVQAGGHATETLRRLGRPKPEHHRIVDDLDGESVSRPDPKTSPCLARQAYLLLGTDFHAKHHMGC